MKSYKKDQRVKVLSAGQRLHRARPGSLGASLTNLLVKLDRSQWWSEQEHTNQQFKQLNALLPHACKTVPFYRQQFEEAGLQPNKITQGNWNVIPLLTRDDLQTNNIVSRDIPKAHGRTYVTQTSGSTGQPVKITSTAYAGLQWQAFTVRDHLWHSRNLEGKLASIRFFASMENTTEGVYAENWGPATANLCKTGPSIVLSVRTSVQQQLRLLARHNPDYLLTYPSNLAALLEHSRQHGVTLPNLKEVRTIGETVTQELRSACRSAWGVPLTDVYSSQELGYIALQCPEYDHYHVMAENALVEIIDEQGKPCQPGETGRIVVTSLHNYATPLIRYEIRDYAEAGAPCPCGRGLPVINRIAGRRRNMLTLPSGEKCWPICGFTRYREVAPIRQFQFIQHSMEHIEMRLVSERILTADDEKRLQIIIQQALGHPFTISFTPMPVIPQGAGGKFDEFISLVSDALGPGKTVSNPEHKMQKA